MNKLVIIGNGFDLAHGLPTRYSDFLLWEINEAFKQPCRINSSSYRIESPLFTVELNYSLVQNSNLEFSKFESIDDFLIYLADKKDGRVNIRITYTYPFIKSLIEFSSKNWVDIEREYYIKLLFVEQLRSSRNNTWRKMLTELNSALDLIKLELERYLKDIKCNSYLQEVMSCFINEIGIKGLINFEEVLFLNFNYTSTIENYLHYIDPRCVSVNYIHGKLEDKNNPIIFGYGDETDDKYAEIEKLNENDFLEYMKSFAYLQTTNYRNLFEFLGKANFEVYVMGHSLGLSDRLLFNHIFEHEKFEKVQLYFYEYKNEKGDVVNDFFQKTQELSRHFKLDAKHRMRSRVVPFNESKPLTIYKP